jgi:hypothetical protein
MIYSRRTTVHDNKPDQVYAGGAKTFKIGFFLLMRFEDA